MFAGTLAETVAFRVPGGGGGGITLNVAVTVVAVVIGTVQEFVPEQPPPDQPTRVVPGSGVAVRVTGVPVLATTEQTEPQLMPAEFEVTVPVAFPPLFTISLLALAVFKP